MLTNQVAAGRFSSLQGRVGLEAEFASGSSRLLASLEPDSHQTPAAPHRCVFLSSHHAHGHHLIALLSGLQVVTTLKSIYGSSLKGWKGYFLRQLRNEWHERKARPCQHPTPTPSNTTNSPPHCPCQRAKCHHLRVGVIATEPTPPQVNQRGKKRKSDGLCLKGQLK